MSLLRLAGFTAVRITLPLAPGRLVAPPSDRAGDAPQRDGRGPARRACASYVSVYHPGSRTTPLDREAQAQFAQYTAALARARSRVRRRDRRQRAEPQPLLAAAVRPATARTPPRPPTCSCSPARTTRSRRSIPASASGAARSRRAAATARGHPPHALADGVHPGARHRLPRERPHAPVMDGLAFHPYPDNSSQSPDVPHPRSTTIGLADYDKLVALLGEAFDGTAQPGSSLPILYDEFGIESDRAGRQEEPLHRAPSRRRRARPTSDGRLPPTTSGSGSRSASRTSPGSCSSTRRTSARS